MAESRWKQFRYWLEWLGCEALVSAIPFLSRRACVQLAQVVGALAYWCDVRGRAVALANLEAAFGDIYSPSQRRGIARRSYQNFTRTMLDLFWSPRLLRADRAKYLTLEGGEVLRNLRAQGRGAIVLCAHNLNFEWASLAGGFAGDTGMIVTKDFKNPRLSSVFDSRRQISGHQRIVQESSVLRLLKYVKRGGIGGLLIDLNVPPTKAATVIEAFGMEMCVTILHALLAQRIGAALVPIEGRAAPDGSCRAIFHPPLPIAADATVQEIAQTCWNFFEKIIRERPDEWMWVYKHWRYKPRGAPRPYPFYAHRSGRFEKLRRLAGFAS